MCFKTYIGLLHLPCYHMFGKKIVAMSWQVTHVFVNKPLVNVV